MIVALVVLVLFFAQEWLLMAVIISFAFLYYILNTIEPPQHQYHLDQKGVLLPQMDTPLPWKAISHFWLSQRWGHTVVNLVTKLADYPFIQFVVPANKKKAAQQILLRHLPEVPAPVNSADKVSSWLYRHLPLQR